MRGGGGMTNGRGWGVSALERARFTPDIQIFIFLLYQSQAGPLLPPKFMIVNALIGVYL
jgi:hypothetical protein